MKIKEAVCALETFAPLPLQESYDNAGLQVGLTERELSGALLCLDVTEAVLDVAIKEGCNLIVAHHPLLFHGLKCVSDGDYVQRIVMKAVKHDLTIYAAHTNLDNAKGGVNFRAAQLLGLQNVEFLQPMADGSGGGGAVGDLPDAVPASEFVLRVKEAFGARWLLHNCCRKPKVKRVALCCGAGAFMIDDAVRAGADMFITGEMGHHRYFNYSDDLHICALGHYQSEIHVADLLCDILRDALPGLRTVVYRNTDPEELVV